MTGFMEARYANKSDIIRVSLSDGLLRYWENKQLVYTSKNNRSDIEKFVTGWLKEDFMPGYRFLALQCEDDVETGCDCWKKGLE